MYLFHASLLCMHKFYAFYLIEQIIFKTDFLCMLFSPAWILYSLLCVGGVCMSSVFRNDVLDYNPCLLTYTSFVMFRFKLLLYAIVILMSAPPGLRYMEYVPVPGQHLGGRQYFGDPGAIVLYVVEMSQQ
jgi:hypothetical protein